MSAVGGLGGGMFEDQNQNQPTVDSAPQPAGPPAVSNVRVASSTAAPPTVVTPTAPPLASSMAPAQDTSQPFPGNQPQVPSPLSNVQLESAYIPTSPAQARGEESVPTAKPSAASMVTAADEGPLLKLKQQALQNLAGLDKYRS